MKLIVRAAARGFARARRYNQAMRPISNSLLFLTALGFAFAVAGSSAFAQTPSVSQGGVLNAASSDQTGQPVALGSLVSIYDPIWFLPQHRPGPFRCPRSCLE